MSTSLIVCIIGGVLYVLVNLDVKRDWAPWTELFRLMFFSGLLAFLLRG